VSHLGELLGQRVVASVPLTAPRANRKPVLHLLDSRGRTVAFVKVGINPLTRDLVRREAVNLRMLAGAELRTIARPQVLHAGTWNDLELLILAPLPTRRATEPTPALLNSAMHELAEMPTPGDTCDDVASYPNVLLDRADRASAQLSLQDRDAMTSLRGYLASLSADPETAELRLGTWHGDWTVWNCGQVGDRLMLWDWERCRPLVPRGFDALHYAVQRAVVFDRRPPAATARWCLQDAPRLLGSWGLSSRQAALVAALYLAEIGLRYLMDDQRNLGGPAGDIRGWILPALEAALRSSASEKTA
jgi:hypothetical protein